MFDLWVMLGFGVAGYGLRKLEYDLAPFVIAFVLAPLLEQSLRQSLVMSPDGAMIFGPGRRSVKRSVGALALAAVIATPVVAQTANPKDPNDEVADLRTSRTGPRPLNFP